jgi:radical SAM superfamily enzyme YgiQ (UPF0313 family)
MKILFVAVNSQYIHTALGMRYITEYCRTKKLPVQLLEESINTPILNCLIKITEQKPDVVGLSVHIWNRNYVFQLIKMLRQVLPQLIIMVGGPEVMFAGTKVQKLLPQVNYVICGEGEELVSDLLTILVNNEDSLDAHTFKVVGNADGTPAVVQDLSILPFPYPDLDAVSKQHKICYYECSRGCPFHCAYCLSGISHAVRRRPLALVLADLQRFMDAGVPLVKFVDRTYNLDEDYYVPILKFLAAAQTNTTFHLEIKADLLSDKVLAFLKTVPQGRLQMEIGVQSTNSETLKAVGRVNDWQELKHNVQLLLSFNNMHIHLDLIAGLPYEDLVSYSKSFNDTYALKPQMLQLGFLKVLPGTVMEQKAEDYGLVYMEEPPYQVLRNKYLSYENLAFLEIFTEVFDLTYNSGLFPRLLDYLVRLENAGAFAFYKKLSLWWRKKELFGKGHTAAHTTELLYNFCTEVYPQELVYIKEVLRYDVLLHQKSFHPEWLGWKTEANYERASAFWRNEEQVRKYLPEYSFSNWRLLKKRYALEEFKFNPLTFTKDGIFALVDYEKAQTYFFKDF